MPLEAGDGFISGLTATNPVGATDPKSQGDDHIRLIKTAVKGTFPNLNGAVTATPAQLNVLATDGAGAGILADLAAIADPNADRVFGWDDSAGAAIAFSLTAPLRATLTAIEIRDDIGVIADLAALTDPNADVFYGWDDSASELIGFTPISGELLFNGTTVGVGSNIPKLNASNVFTGAAQSVVANAATFDVNSQDTSGGYYRWFTSNTARGLIGRGSATAGGAVTDVAIVAVAGGLRFSGDNGTTTHFALSAAGLVTVPNASAQEVGTKGPQTRGFSSNDSSAASDQGNSVTYTGSGGHTFTLDADPPTNAVIVIVNEGSASVTIAASGSLIFAGVTGNRTLPAGCMCAAYHRQGSGVWQIAGQLQ